MPIEIRKWWIKRRSEENQKQANPNKQPDNPAPIPKKLFEKKPGI